MTGLDGVIARVSEIESRIVALDPAARSEAPVAAGVSGAPGATGGTEAASASTFAGILEAAKNATGEASGTGATAGPADETIAAAAPSSAASTQTSAGTAELVTALQTLFAANSGATGGAPSLTQYAGLIG